VSGRHAEELAVIAFVPRANKFPWIAARRTVVRATIAILLISWSSVVQAEEPPLTEPRINRIGSAGGALNFGGWLLFPSFKVFSVFSDNLYQSPRRPVSVAGLAIAPELVAEWTNGIHRTTFYGNAEVRRYNVDEANTFDRQAGFVQRYEAMRDLILTFQGDYTHKTNSNGLLSSIPSALVAPGSVVLPDGNIQLPNGDIVSPNGQPASPSNIVTNVGVGTQTFANPYDQYTATASVYKVFNRAFVRLTGSASWTGYENQATFKDFSVQTFGGGGGFWFSPWLYAYADGTEAVRSDSSAYRAVGGIGSARIGLFSGAIYAGHQGSEFNTGRAGGEIYGGRVSYYPTRQWTLTLTADRTINVSNQTVSNLALDIGSQTPILIPLGASTRITSLAWQSDYFISRQLSTFVRLGYTRVNYINSAKLDEAWLAAAGLKYQVWRNMALNLNYQYSEIVSNSPLASAARHYLTAGATYKF
jgi:opacity protein-like surface antigen